MSKRGPLSKIEKFYIEENVDMTIDELAEELDRAKSVVKAYSDKCQRKQKIAEKSTPLSENIVSNKMGSTVMTETGSMLGDDFRQKSVTKKRSNCTTTITG
jgi:hypothetical protein